MMEQMSYNPINGLLLTFLLIVSIYSSTSNAQIENDTPLEVTISQGTIRGRTLTTSHNRNITAFLGIPYAQPPIGSLRFADPVVADGWTGTRDGGTDASMCPQISDNVAIGDEDCLYLNVYTPLVSQGENLTSLPVMVYIHGGAYVRGGGSYSKLGPQYILNEDVILVTLNYRLGALGFLSTGDNVAPGNWGLKDQILALQWVQDNIEIFGGDPDRVTIFGLSAGGVSVDLLTMSDATNGLFHRGISQSGSAFADVTYQSSDRCASTAFELGKILNCSNDTSIFLINCLQTVKPSDIIASSVSLSWYATDEPDILTDSPANLFAAGHVRNLTQISGVVQDEAVSKTTAYYKDEDLFLDFLGTINSSLVTFLSFTNQPEKAAWVDDIRAYYLNDLTADTNLLLSNLTRLITDYNYYYPPYKVLQQRLSLGIVPQYFYTFNYNGIFSNDSFGIAHGVDMNYLFVTDSVSSDLIEAMSESDYEMVDTMVQLFTTFAINGTPTASALNGTTWKPYSSAEKYCLRIGDGTSATPEVEYCSFEDRMQFWARLEATLNSSGPESNAPGLMTSFPKLLLLSILTGLIFSTNTLSTPFIC